MNKGNVTIHFNELTMVMEENNVRFLVRCAGRGFVFLRWRSNMNKAGARYILA